MPFGQLVIGPPGSGKTTFCYGMQQYMDAIGREAVVVNLDPANDPKGYTPVIDVQDLVCLTTVQEELRLGPNGGLVYCMEFLARNMDWLHERLEIYLRNNTYILFDLPGQVELFSTNGALKSVINDLSRGLGFRLACVHLVDSYLCTEPAKFMSAVTLSLSTMLHLELPHINVLTKMDLIHTYGDLPLPLEFFAEVQDLSFLVNHVAPSGPSSDGKDSAFRQRLQRLTAGICEVVEDFGLVHFMPLAVEDKDLMGRLLTQIDKANGYVFAAYASKDELCPEYAYGSTEDMPREALSDIADKYVGRNGSQQPSSSAAMRQAPPR